LSGSSKKEAVGVPIVSEFDELVDMALGPGEAVTEVAGVVAADSSFAPSGPWDSSKNEARSGLRYGKEEEGGVSPRLARCGLPSSICSLWPVLAGKEPCEGAEACACSPTGDGGGSGGKSLEGNLNLAPAVPGA